MKPVEATWEGRVRRGGYLEPFVLLEPPAHNPGCSCVIGMHLSAACSHVVDIFNTLRTGHVDSRKISPHRL